MLREFLAWYDKHVEANLAVSAVIIYLQIPHLIWAGDLFLANCKYLCGINTIFDFILYGIDLIEAIPMIQIGLALFVRRCKIVESFKKLIKFLLN